jgi:hypothetical protein
LTLKHAPALLSEKAVLQQYHQQVYASSHSVAARVQAQAAQDAAQLSVAALQELRANPGFLSAK